MRDFKQNKKHSPFINGAFFVMQSDFIIKPATANGAFALDSDLAFAWQCFITLITNFPTLGNHIQVGNADAQLGL